MAKLKTYTLAAAVALLAGADWFVADAPAGGDGGTNLKVGKATVTAAFREIEKDGKKETHVVVEVAGEETGKITVRLQETPFIPESRMMPRPKTRWTKDVELSKASTDLGAVTLKKMAGYAIEASSDGKTFVRLARQGAVELDE